MPTAATQFQPDTGVLREFIRWIEQFDKRHARAWALRYKADAEAATCEAMFWGVLTDCGVTVEPNADLTGGKRAPDFVCHKHGQKFYVEVTCIHIDTATEHTALEHMPKTGGGFYSPLNDAIFKEVVSKTPQCANLDAPCVLAIGTFHHCASASCVCKIFTEWLLTGVSQIGFHFDPRLGQVVGEPFELTHLKSATFVRPSNLVGVEPARQPVSALLIAGFGCKPPPILGALHPNPAREFAPQLLDRIAFCWLKTDVLAATMTTEWTFVPEPENEA